MITSNKIEIKNKEKLFEINSNKNIKINFHFINKGNSLIILANKKKGNLKLEYENEFDLFYIRKIKLFQVYDSIDECLD